MKKNVQWTVAALLALLLALSACSSNKAGNAKEEVDTSPNESAAASPSEAASMPEPPSPIKIYTPDTSYALPSGKFLDNPTAKYLAEKTNTVLDVQFLPNANYLEQLKLKFAAGDFPDAFLSFGLNQQDGALENGLLLPLNDLIDKYGPNLKKNIPQYAWDAVTLNGQIYGIPEPSIQPSARTFFIRKDWLDKVQLGIPKTSDELLNVLRAFRDQDVNGNGDPNDEVPLATRAYAWSDENIWGMWGLQPGVSTEYEGKIIPGMIHPRFKEALRFLQTAYQEGLLDKEYLASDLSKWRQKIYSDRAGVWGWTPEGVWSFQNEIDATSPNAKADVIAIPTPVGAGFDGQAGAQILPVGKIYQVLKSSEHPEAIVQFFDWLLSDEGQIFSEIGIEGINYKKENGKIVYDPESEKKEASEWRLLFEMHGLNQTAFEAKYDETQRAKLQAAYDISSHEGFPNLTEGMPPVSSEFQPLYGTAYQEAASKIIVDNAPVDVTWDAFVESWRKQGGDKLIEQLTTWYYNNKKK